MTQRPATKQQLARRLDRLVRSLVGVVEHVPVWDRHGRLVGMDILRHEDVQEHQLVRNVVSGLGAGCGIRLDRSAVRVHDDADSFSAAVAAQAPAHASTVVQDTAAATGGQDREAVGNGHGNGHANGNGGNGHGHGGGHAGGAVRGVTRPGMGVSATGGGAELRPRPVATDRVVSTGSGGTARRAAAAAGEARVLPRALSPEERQVLPATASVGMRLETMHVERHGGLLRCRVVLALETNRYSAIADMPDGATAETELAARVTLDAMRAGGFTGARLEAAGLATLGDETFVVVSIRDAGSGMLRGGIAPLVDSLAHAAATAALQGIGPITARQRDSVERELGRL